MELPEEAMPPAEAAEPVAIATFHATFEAELAKTRLEDAGIPAFLTNEQLVNVNWLLSNATGGVRLFVPAEREAEARALLATEVSEEEVAAAEQAWEQEEQPAEESGATSTEG
jgi:hypothetical protein